MTAFLTLAKNAIDAVAEVCVSRYMSTKSVGGINVKSIGKRLNNLDASSIEL